MKNKILIVGCSIETSLLKLWARPSAPDLVVLANDQPIGEVLALENEFALDNDGWALLAPYGEFPNERTIERDGQPVHEKFIQIFDPAGVDTVLENERGEGVLARLKRALIKRPIFKGHPDATLYTPNLLDRSKEKLVALGLVDSSRKASRGLEIKPQLVPDGAVAVERDGCKFLSGLFEFRRTGVVRPNGDIEVRPLRILSVGLTPFPNISGVDSLANAKPADQQQQTQTKEPDMKLIAGWLIAQNVALANCENPTEQMVLEAIKKTFDAKTTDLVTLGNDKSTLTTTVTSLTTDRDAQKKRADEAALALANEQTSFKAERRARCEAVVDLVITQGRLEVAGRDGKITELVALDNAKLATEIEALGKLPVKFKVASDLSGDHKAGAATAKSASEAVLALANEDARYKGKPFTPELFAKILNENPALKEQLSPAAAAAATK